MRRNTKVDDGILVEDIRRVAKEIGRTPRQDDYKKYGTFSLNTVIRRRPWNVWLVDIFGQTNKERAPRTEKVLDFELMEDISRVAKMLGKTPTQREYGEHGSYSLTMALRRKKWNDWLESAVGSVNYDRTDGKTRKISDQELIDDVRRVANELGRTPARGEYNTMGHYSSDTIVARKSWEEFVKGACNDMPAPTHINRTKTTDEELLAQLKDMERKLGRVPLKDDLGGQNGFGYSTFVRAFGTFGNALVAAGLIDPLQRHCASRQELIDELKRIYILLGHTPSQEEFLTKSIMKSAGPIYTEFGSWTKALLASDVPVVKANGVSIEDIKTALKKWYAENNCDDTCLEYWKVRKAHARREFPYSCVTVSAKFHPLSWEEIMHECGFPNYITRNYYITGRRRGDHTGVDGKEYLSSLEKEIGDFLFELKNSNKIKDYEYEAKVCANKAWTCDFKVIFSDDGVLWLEADGLRNNRYNPYTSGANEKIKFYTDNNMNFKIISYSAPNIRKEVEKVIFSIKVSQ